MPIHERIHIRTASDGYRLACRHLTPEANPRGWLVMLHGIQSHSGWYEFTQQQLAAAGYDMRFPDRRGSGLNDADRGHAPHWQRLVNDVVHFLNDARAERDGRAPAAPVFLGGLSWGGRLAMAVARLRPDLIDGLILLYPGIEVRVGPFWNDRCRLKLAEWLGVLRRTVSVPLDDPALFTSQPRWQQFIRDDRLALHEVTTGFLIASERLRQICRQRTTADSSLPVLLMLAEQDEIVNNRRTTELVRRVWGSTFNTITFPAARHTLEFELCREQYIRELLSWMQQRRRGIIAESG